MGQNSSEFVIGAGAPVPAVRCMEWMDESVEVPKDVAICPECSYTLEAVVDGWTEGKGYSISVNCGMDDFLDGWHSYWQGEWQPVIDVVTRWANSSIEKLTDPTEAQPR